MRNWNPVMSPAGTDPGDFQPTYEELKQRYTRHQQLTFRISAYLWGIETSLRTTAIRYHARAYFQPTYEGETQNLPRKGWLHSQFQPTYENWNTDVPFSYTGQEIFQPTYEELKPRIVDDTIKHFVDFSLPMRNWNTEQNGRSCVKRRYFQPTYEELKRHFAPAPFPLDIFPAYLWGIETQVRTTPKEPCGVISSLPMRNWNWCKNAATRKIALISSLPMRNWNTSRISSGVDGTLFPAYLWGIETQYLLCDKTVMEEFPAYLWGIETRNIQR